MDERKFMVIEGEGLPEEPPPEPGPEFEPGTTHLRVCGWLTRMGTPCGIPGVPEYIATRKGGQEFGYRQVVRFTCHRHVDIAWADGWSVARLKYMKDPYVYLDAE